MHTNKPVLLLQSRPPEIAAVEEENFAALVAPASLVAVNALQGAAAKVDVRIYSHVLMGGSSCNISDGHQDWFDDTHRIIRDSARYGIPFLGICFGMQMLALAFGGRVTAGQRIGGTVLVTMHDAHASFFSKIPTMFLANEVHGDYVEAPKDFWVLATSGSGTTEIIAHKTLPLYGVQFHPEHTRETARELLRAADRIPGTYRFSEYAHLVEPFVPQPPVLQRFLADT